MVIGLLAMLAMSFLGSACFRRYALAKKILDIPNERSAHELPTPRGGGIVFAACFLFTLPLLLKVYSLNPIVILTLMVSGTLITFTGFLDDYYDLSAALRLLAHFSLSGISVYMMGGVPDLPLFYNYSLPAWFGSGLFVIYLVWLLNLYNFMDGIDGIASIEAISVCLVMALVYTLNHQIAMAYLPLWLFSSVTGFLFWNFPKARLFMGDSGSSFLGFIFGLFSLLAIQINPDLFACWLIMLALFVTDATVTLLQRLYSGEPVFQAHSSHAYQHAARYFSRHLPVSLLVLVINLLYLMPIALATGLGYIHSVYGLILAYMPLGILVYFLNAGRAHKL